MNKVNNKKLEKVKFVYDFCANSKGCVDCVLSSKHHKWKNQFMANYCLDILQSDEEDLDKAIRLIQMSKDLAKVHDVKTLKKALNVKDNVNSPSHYTDGKIEVIDYIEDKKLGFCLGNAIKYISRAGKKDKDKEVEDIKKAIWYLKRYIKNLEEAD